MTKAAAIEEMYMMTSRQAFSTTEDSLGTANRRSGSDDNPLAVV